MNKNTTLTTIIIAITSFCLIFIKGSCQNVGINASGTTPDPSALLDVNASPGNNKGILIPRMTAGQMSAIASPATGLMIYNTDCNIFEYWSGTAWVSFPTSPNVPTAVNASANPNPICAGNTLTLTGSATGALSWSWTGPNGFNSALQNPTVTNITTSAAGIYFLTASNLCGSSVAAATTSVTVNTVPTSVTASASPNPVVVCASDILNLTGNATGATTWSWSGPNSFTSTSQSPIISSITAAAAGTYTLTAINSCGSPTAITAAVTVNTTECVPITLTNSQTSATVSNFHQKLTINSSTYSSYENSSLNNVEFTTGPSGTGTILYAWIESGATNASTSTVYWVNLGSNSIAANGGTLTIYMNFLASNVMTTGYTGEAPQLYGGSYAQTSYAQYDNGANVFIFYDNFAGTSLSSQWSTGAGTSVSVNNGLTLHPDITICNGDITTNANFNAGNTIDYYGSLPTANASNQGDVSIGFTPNACFTSDYAAIDYPAVGTFWRIEGGSTYPNTGYSTGTYIWTVGRTPSTVYVSQDYGSVQSIAASASSFSSPLEVLNQENSTGSAIGTWIRVRNSPPSYVMPSVAFGPVCP